MSDKNGGSAFPHDEVINNSLIYEGESGMTLRDYFAAKALQAIIARLPESFDLPGDDRMDASKALYAKGAYEYADAMIAARAA